MTAVDWYTRQDNTSFSISMAAPPSRIRTQRIPDAGTGLFASDAIPPGVEILRIDRPLVSVLDSPHLRDTCSDCSLWLPENGHYWGPQTKRLKICQGCKTTRYCCTVCFVLLYSMPLKEAFTILPSPFITSKRSYMSILESLIPLSCPTCAKSFEPCGVQSSFL